MRRVLGLATAVLLAVSACGGDDGPAEPERTSPTSAQSSGDGSGRYVALGDSYSAGGGAEPYRNDGTGCFRSDGAWPVLIGADDGGVDLLACGGATIQSLLDGDRAVQLPEEPADDVDLVTVTIGFNDVSFVQFMFSCVAGDCVTAQVDQEAVDKALDGVFDGLVGDLYPTLRARFPNARIVHVAYPQLFPASNQEVANCPWLTELERRFMRSYQDDFDAMLADAVAEAGEDGLDIELLDLPDALAGHELCSADTQFVPLTKPDGSGGHLDPAGYTTLAAAIRSEL